MTHSRVGGTAGMGLAGVQVNGLLERAAEAVESVSADPVADEVDAGLHAPADALCAVCHAPMLARDAVRRAPAGLRHESCP